MFDTHREPAGGVGEGAVEGGRVLVEIQMMSQNLYLICWCWEAASAIGPHHRHENPVTSQSLQLSNSGTVLCINDSTVQNSGRIVHLEVLTTNFFVKSHFKTAFYKISASSGY